MTTATTADRAPSRAVLLTQYLLQRPQTFSWAEANCCHFGAGWMRFATGFDPMSGLRATRSARAARRLVDELGGSLEAAWTQRLQRDPIPPLLAQQGDIVLIKLLQETGFGTGACVGVCTGPQIAIATAEGHVALLPLSCGDAAWRLEAQA